MSYLRIGLVGVGRWGERLLRVFSEVERCEVTAVCDTSGPRLARVLDADLCRTESLEALLAGPSVDAVAIATPSASHARLTCAALRAQKDVFVEKPMALTLSDSRAMVEAARRASRRLMVGHVLAYHPAVVELERMVQLGRLGRLERIVSSRLSPGAARDGETAWWSLAPHDVSLANLLFRADPLRVTATPGPSGDRLGVTARFSFPGHRTLDLRVGFSAAEKRRRVVVQGTEGTAVFDDLLSADKLRLYPSAVDVDRLCRDGEPPGATPGAVPVLPETEPLLAEARHFVGGVLDGTAIRTDGHEGTRVVAALAAGARSLRARGEHIWVPADAPVIGQEGNF